ncbi:unnamed protein product, partial [Iphiclides podalirius]
MSLKLNEQKRARIKPLRRNRPASRAESVAEQSRAVRGFNAAWSKQAASDFSHVAATAPIRGTGQLFPRSCHRVDPVPAIGPSTPRWTIRLTKPRRLVAERFPRANGPPRPGCTGGIPARTTSNPGPFRFSGEVACQTGDGTETTEQARVGQPRHAAKTAEMPIQKTHR